MNTAILASLEKAIGDCLDKAAESSEHWPNGYQSPDLVVNMAKAAALVFDANYDGQEYAKREEEGDKRP